ncbi:hypothetical protein COLO4_04577 [Corchorus olitorius]|uniref:Uncharacterized protein n=1 Tax=Corchorus olitorius TaxID=93759 RepID=A0A1R3KTF9_9ROSI|nr:hypothetical protein COLO4_04577 [Corchorus olitorius]
MKKRAPLMKPIGGLRGDKQGFCSGGGVKQSICESKVAQKHAAPSSDGEDAKNSITTRKRKVRSKPNKEVANINSKNVKANNNLPWMLHHFSAQLQVHSEQVVASNPMDAGSPSYSPDPIAKIVEYDQQLKLKAKVTTACKTAPPSSKEINIQKEIDEHLAKVAALRTELSDLAKQRETSIIEECNQILEEAKELNKSKSDFLEVNKEKDYFDNLLIGFDNLLIGMEDECKLWRNYLPEILNPEVLENEKKNE